MLLAIMIGIVIGCSAESWKTAIFAPTRLSTTIVHDWEYYDETENDWVLRSSVSFAINGGREKGFRGYTISDSAEVGKWRVNVKNGGKLVGRVSFRIENTEAPVATQTVER